MTRAVWALLAAVVATAAEAQPPVSEEWAEGEELIDEEAVEAASDEAVGEHTEEALEEAASYPESGTPIALPTGEAKSAVTPQAISLPSAEGSIQGMGESFSPVLSSGTGTFSVPIALPAGRAGVQPSLGLSYSTSGGNGIVGFGWGLGAPFIARQTDRGLPNYVDRAGYHAEEDRFIYNGGQELVPVDHAAIAAVDFDDPSGGAYATYSAAANLPDGVSTAWQQYRARVEGGFMRFFRSPDSRRWVVQSKDGTRFEFGVLGSDEGGPPGFDSTPALQTELDDGSGPAFQWLLTRMSDPHGSTIYYQYFVDRGERYLSDIYYLSPASCAGSSHITTRRCSASLSNYGARVHLQYEARPDVFSTYITSWRVETALRLSRVTVSAAGMSVGTRYIARRYHLAYDETSFHSLLSSLTVEGRPQLYDATLQVNVGYDMTESYGGTGFLGETLPPMRFTYEAPPTGSIAGFGGIDSTLRSATYSPPHSVDEGRTDLFDVNSDGLPDVIVTDPARYRTSDGRPSVGVFFNGFSGRDARPASAGTFSDAVPVPVGRGLSGILNLDNHNIVPMDIDGDGRSDLLDMPRRTTYGWFTPTRGVDAATAEVSPARQSWRFSYAEVNLPRGVLDPRIDLDRDSAHIRTFDVNNDHLVDVVRTTGTSIQTWLNLGWLPGGEGRFGSATYTGTAWELSVEPYESCLLHDGVPLDFSDPEVRLGDMNGDGLQDIVKVRRGRVAWWAGRGLGVWGEGSADCPPGFEGDREILMETPPMELDPELQSVSLADVNSDGADDLVQVRFDQVDVWFNRAGASFTDRVTVRTTARAPGFAPRIRFADVDGSGTLDLLYGVASNYQYLDFMGGERPRVLVHVENGLGGTTELEYETSADDYLRDLNAAASCTGTSCTRFTWSQVSGAGGCDPKLRESTTDTECYFSGGSPVVSTVVRAMQTSDHFDRLGRAENVIRTEYAYHDGYYEGIEQEFRGFGAADAVAIGDDEHPTSTTRSYFHQGRRPSSIARNRLAENPGESLKARSYLTETFDTTGEYVSSVHTSYIVRHLMTGLDGRDIRYAFVGTTNDLRYDVVAWTTATTSYASQPAIEWERYDATAGTVVTTSTETTGIKIRGVGHARMFSQTQLVDNMGNLLTSAAFGRLRGENGESPPSERITSNLRAILVDQARWIWRTERTYTTGAGFSGSFGFTRFFYNASGDLTRQYTDANIGSTVLSFAGDLAGTGYTLADQLLDSSNLYDAWGNATNVCGGANITTASNKHLCLRYGEVDYENAYEALPEEERIAVEKTGTTLSFLSTRASWHRGYGLLLSATDVSNDTITEVGYDGLGRITFIRPTRVDDSMVPAPSPTHRFSYELVPGGLPVSIVYAYQENDDTIGDDTIESRSYVDGLGRARASLVASAANQWEQSGIVEFTARGSTLRSWQPHFIASAAPSPRHAVARPSWLTHTVEIGCNTSALYDPFGRQTAATDCDASTITSYRALSVEVYDPHDMDAGDPETSGDEHPFYNTPAITRYDGHGRAIEQMLQNKRFNGTDWDDAEFYRLRSTYRPDGAVTEIRRAKVNSVAYNATVDGGNEVVRTFTYDTAGRRIASTDPDSDNAGAAVGARTWRYLFNPAGDLAAVRDPRGCGQNFFYDRAGRLIGEDYIGCTTESQVQGDTPDEDIPAGSVGLGDVASTTAVDARYFFDEDPPWETAFGATTPARPSTTFASGRLTGTSNRAERSVVSYDERGRVTWTGRQIALIPEQATIDTTLADPPAVDTMDSVTPGTRLFDETHTYAIANAYDHGNRPLEMTFPEDPDWALFDTSMDPAPVIEGRITYQARNLPASISLGVDSDTYPIISSFTYSRDRLPTGLVFGDTAGSSRTASQLAWTYETTRRRPLSFKFDRQQATTMTGDIDEIGPTAINDVYTWDAASNLTSVTQDELDQADHPSGHKPVEFIPTYDALYRVAQVDFQYDGPSGWTNTDAASDWRSTRATHRAADPMRERPAAMLPTIASNRVQTLQYDYDWLANMTSWTDDADNFYERSIGAITNGGTTTGLRPSALYLSTNLETTAPSYSAGFDRGGWLEVDYGVSGNVVALTVHARCTDQASGNVCYDGGGSLSTRRSNLRSRCVCAGEQHYQYRYDELNRISEARRYDRGGTGSWNLQVRQRYRYDAGNTRVIKQTMEETPDPGERIALYVFPGDYERSGVVRDGTNFEYDASTTLGTETQYLVGGARVVWKTNPMMGSWNLSRDVRVTYAVTDLIQSTAMVFDVWSGKLLETRTHYPNGATETHRAQSSTTMQLEPLSFTGKQADDEVGITYFGQRYLLQHLGRWANPDPLAVHAVGGGEALNAFHYVAGNLLQARDPTGLWPLDVESIVEQAFDRVGDGFRRIGENPAEALRGAVAATVDNHTNGALTFAVDAINGQGTMAARMSETDARAEGYAMTSIAIPLLQVGVGTLVAGGGVVAGGGIAVGSGGVLTPVGGVVAGGAVVAGVAVAGAGIASSPGAISRAWNVDRARQRRGPQISQMAGKRPRDRGARIDQRRARNAEREAHRDREGDLDGDDPGPRESEGPPRQAGETPQAQRQRQAQEIGDRQRRNFSEGDRSIESTEGSQQDLQTELNRVRTQADGDEFDPTSGPDPTTE